MNWTYFWIFIVIGILFYIIYLFFSQRQMAYLSILLYRQGNADAYLKALETPSVRFFFPKKLRRLMSIDAYLLKRDVQMLYEVFREAEMMKLPTADRMIVMIKKFAFLLDQNKLAEAKLCHAEIHRLYDQLSNRQKKQHEPMVQESDYTNAIVVNKSGYYADELMEKGRLIKDDISSGVYYYKAAQSYYLRTDLKRCESALEYAEVRLRKTTFHPQIQKILKTKEFDLLVGINI